MRITINELPSRGIDDRSEEININPLTFRDLLTYTRNQESAKDELSKFLVDYNQFKSKVNNWKSISLMDLDYLIFRYKKLTVSDDKEFSVELTCEDCGSRNQLYLDSTLINVSKQLRYDYRGSIVLNNKTYTYEVPTLEFFDSVLTKIIKYNKGFELKLIKLITCFPDFKNSPNEIESLVVNAKGDDIIRLSVLYSMYFDSKININHKCKNCSGGHWSIEVRSLIDQVFLSMLLSRTDVTNEIITKQIY